MIFPYDNLLFLLYFRFSMICVKRLSFTIIIFLIGLSLRGQQSFDRQAEKVGNIGLSVTNVGTIGRPDVRNDPQGDPSMEYPINSGIEHLFEGGLWIGAQVNGQTAVSTATVDAPSGYTTGGSGFEMTAEIGQSIKQRSTLPTSEHFSFDAISHQDLVMDFSDKNTIVPGTNTQIADHNLPLYADVHLETYAWNYSFADYFVIMSYDITNNSTDTWDSVYLGLWTDLVVRNINVATDGGAAFFNKGAGGFIDSMQALYAFDVNGDPGYTNSYGASQILGVNWRGIFMHPDNADSIQGLGFTVPTVFANFWNFRSFDGTEFGAPANDVDRYEKLSSDHNWNDPGLVTGIQNPSNRVQLLSIGPIREIAPGETVNFTLAIVAAHQMETGGTTGPQMDTKFARTELFEHLGWAKRTYAGEDLNNNGMLDPGEDLNHNGKLDRYILPEPPDIPHVKIIPDNGTVEVYWDNSAEYSIDPISKKRDFEGYRIYRTNAGDDQQSNLISQANLIAQFDKAGDNIGYNNDFDAVKLPEAKYFEGDTIPYSYKMTLDNLLNGWQYLIMITAFDSGDETLNIPSLESSYIANSYRVWPGTLVDLADTASPAVYPNPYRLQAAWDGSSSRTHKLYFYNLPALCTITVYTGSGDVVAVLDHDSGTYTGDDIQWYDNYGGDDTKRSMTGGEHAWDILTQSKQTITQGLYFFSVKDLSTGVLKQGKFVVLK